jgi:hypothetical protein
VDLQTLFDAWLPGNFIIAVHGSLSRRETMQVVPNHSALYSLKISKGRHSEFGGATTSVWNFIHLSRLARPFALSELMTSEHYTHTLQALLDDTLGLLQVKYCFESCFGQDYIGLVTLKATGTQLRVFDADGLAPDLAAIQPSRFWFFWVSASSVWARKQNIETCPAPRTFCYLGLRRKAVLPFSVKERINDSVATLFVFSTGKASTIGCSSHAAARS